MASRLSERGERKAAAMVRDTILKISKWYFLSIIMGRKLPIIFFSIFKLYKLKRKHVKSNSLR
jgi:hypothetical protein